MERVNEGVPAARGAVRGRVETSRIDQARGSRQGLEALVDRIRIEPERGRDGARGELATGCASCLEDPLILVGQALDLPLDQVPQAVRKDLAERLHSLPQSPASVLLREDPLRHELVEQRGEKERIPVGDLENRGPEARAGARCAGKRSERYRCTSAPESAPSASSRA